MSDLRISVSYGATLNTTEIEGDQIEATEASSEPSEFERFEAFAAKLVVVPKTEVDALREDS